ncbi:unnamed protein product [Aspergillus oryzae]|uniref:Unnamed protein product n=2 Tax=Aspergillus oryzae TaxID=5062 RepID=A0AAN4Y716_ASPOZ|nr:unnamed protein product [Aspergillus oryzae]GMF84458.1 unnamed protein product [Aspergillus oryzae]GMG17409.1 unnamed protein product [Aspergillus oryzae]GMG23872.1 unnamed protein product [Aspergillus oryzae]GMG44360.1 unnamed protein product [Aspergillus oryzae var. brunneus]
MLGSWGLVPRSTSVWAAALIILCQLVPLAVALRTAPGSPCANVCNKQSTNTTGSEITCLDTDFTSTSKGSQFKQCVDCQLRSTYSDPSSGETDVDWGLCKYTPAPPVGCSLTIRALQTTFVILLPPVSMASLRV